MFLPCCMHVPCKTRRFQVDRVRMLLFLSMGSTSRKNTVCLLLKFWPPGINPELMMEWKLIANPTWHMYWKQPLGIQTLSCKVRSMRLRPEWPWRARRYKIAPDESVQYWNMFFSPPPAALPFFIRPMLKKTQNSSEDKLILQNSIAPSLSRGRLPRRRRINFFDTK